MIESPPPQPSPGGGNSRWRLIVITTTVLAIACAVSSSMKDRNLFGSVIHFGMTASGDFGGDGAAATATASLAVVVETDETESKTIDIEDDSIDRPSGVIAVEASGKIGITDKHGHNKDLESSGVWASSLEAMRISKASIRKYCASSSSTSDVLDLETPEEPNDGSSPLKKNNNNEMASSGKKVLNIHVVPHTHDDVGWLKTVDQYYNGWNNTIQEVNVREILTSVVEALEENPSRTFTFVETKFFVMWWNEQTEAVREKVKKLVKETKQFTFTNGGWCMHDEAATHYIGMIDQTTLGHDFLKQTFGYVPTVGWQLDPFGHSATQSSLMTYKMGFDALYFGRIDYQDLELRHATKECEGLWNAFDSNSKTKSDNGGTSAIDTNLDDDEGSIFWGLTGSYGGNYGAPGGYCLDPHCGPGQKVFIDKNRKQLIGMIEDFLQAVREQSDRTKGDHVMLTMGSDFQYQRASINFANLDLLIGTITHLQEDATLDIPGILGPEYNEVKIFYSSPEYYTRCKYGETVSYRKRSKQKKQTSADGKNDSESSNHHLRKSYNQGSKTGAGTHRKLSGPTNELEATENLSSPSQWITKRDDFLPYSDCPNCFWTGYFTSRPALKRFERVASSFLLAARQVESFVTTASGGSSGKEPHQPMEGNDDSCEGPMLSLEDAVGVLQHHDGLSGTSKQHVAYDYAKTLQAGIDAVVPCTIRKLKTRLLGDGSNKFLKDLSYCQLLNETKCGVSVDTTAESIDSENCDEKDLYAVVYNSLASNRSAPIDLPVGSDGFYLVEDMEQGSAETIEALQMPLQSPNDKLGGDSFVLSFMAESLPAAGAKVFRIQKHKDAIGNRKRVDGLLNERKQQSTKRQDGMVEISNGHFSILVDHESGNIRRIGTQDVESLSTWGYYTSFDGDRDAIQKDDDHNSGAYIFRPSTPNQKLQEVRSSNATMVHSSIGTEIHTEYEEPWIRTTTRIRKGLPYIEIEYQVGPIPIGDGRGKEVITRYNTMVNNDATFYTDSNGRKFMKRKRNHRPTWDLTVFQPVAGNYYPVNAAIYIDEKEESRNDASGLRDNGPSFAVVTDRTQGGGSILDGTIELMVHRRTVVDDHRGVDEPLNETDVGITPCHPFGNATRIGDGLIIRGKHRILVEKTKCQESSVHDCGAEGGARLARSVMDASFAEPLVFVGSSASSEEIPFKTKNFSGLKAPLPENVMLITKRLLYNKEETGRSYLIRLGHQYGESVNVDLSSLFPRQSIEGIQEMTLSGNRDLDDWTKERLDWSQTGTRTAYKEDTSDLQEAHTITLSNMDIRTIVVKVKSIF